MKTKLTFKKRLVSGFLALVMVLGFLPANLFPAAKAADGDLRIDSFVVDDKGHYTLKLSYKSTVGNWGGTFLTVSLDGSTYSNKGRPSDSVGTGKDFTSNTNTTTAAEGRLSSSYGLPNTLIATSVMLTSPKSVDTSGARPVYTFEGDLTTKSGGAFTMAALKSTITGGNYYQSGTKLDGSTVPLFAFVRLGATADVAGKSSTMVSSDMTATPNPIQVVYDLDGNWDINGTPGTASEVTVTFTNETATNYIINPLEVTSGPIYSYYFDNGDGTLFAFGADEIVVEGGGSAEVTIDFSGISMYWLSVNETFTIPYTTEAGKKVGELQLPIELVFTGGWRTSDIVGSISAGTQQEFSTTIIWTGDETTFSAGSFMFADGSNFVSDAYNGGYFKVERINTDSSLTDETASESITAATGDKFKITVKADASGLSASDGSIKDSFTVAEDNNSVSGYIAVDLTITESTTYNVDFNLNGAPGTAPATQNIAAGGTVSKPADPSWDANHAFDGWWTTANDTGSQWNFDSDTVSGDMTLYAHWTEKYTVTFAGNKPSSAATGNNVSGVPSAQTVARGQKATLPTSPTLNGYSFLGWDTNKDSTNPSWTNAATAPTINGNVTYHAIWKVEPVTFENVVFGGKKDTTPVIDTTSGGLGYPTAGGHNKTDFTYEFFDSTGAPQGTTSYTMNGVTYSFNSSGQLEASGNLAEAKKGEFTIKATSTLNGQSATATVTLQVPPRVNSGSMQENSLLPGKTVHTAELGLTDGTKIPADVNWSGIKTAQWYWGFGGTMVGITNTSEQGPTMKTDISGATNVQQVTIPADAITGSHLWLKVTGDGTAVDTGVTQKEGGGEAIWVDMGEIGKDRRSIVVVPSVWTTSGTKVSTTPADIKANAVPGQLGAGESGQLNTISTSTEYVFVGWSMNDSNTGYTTPGGSLTGPGGNWTVATESPYLSSGRNSATFNMKTLPTSEDPIKIYAIYKQVETRTITVVMEPGVKSVQYAIGSTTKEETNTGTTAKTFTIKPKTTDSVTFIASPGNNSICNGYTFNPDSPGVAFSIITGDNKSTVSLTAKQDFTITFQAKSVADLHVSGTSHYTSKMEGYGSLAGSPIFTATLTNPGARDATIDTANSGLYADNSGAISNNKYTGTDFTMAPAVYGTIPANTADNSTAYQIKVTPKDGLPAGTYTVWLKITENTGDNNTKQGKNLVYTQKITFVVTDKDTFTGKVTVKLNGAATSTGVTKVEAKSGNDTAITMTGSGGVYTTAADALSVGKTYNVLINGEDTGYVLHAAAKEQEINFYTLDTSVSPASAAVDPGETLASGKKITGLGYIQGAVVTLTANAPTGSYVFDHWTETTNSGTPDNTKTSKVVSIIMSGQKDVVANYVATVTRTYDYGYNRTGGRTFYTQSGLKSGTAYGAITPVPSRPGYTFDKWVTTDGGTTEVDFKVALTADQTVYASWTKNTPTWSTLPSGEYGKDYNGTAAITSGNVGTITSYTATGLPAGLTMDTSGKITGKSQVVTGSPFSVTVTATNEEGEEWTHDYELIINKATPVITGVNFSAASGSILEGMSTTDLRVAATVKAPYYDGTWEDVSYTYSGYTLGASGTNPGTLALNPGIGSNVNFGGSSSKDVTLELTPTGMYDAIYNHATAPGHINKGGSSFRFTAKDNPTEFAAKTSDPLPASKNIRVINTGDDTGYFTYELGGATSDFTVTSADIPTNDTSSRKLLAKNNYGDIVVRPTAAAQASVGTHTMTVHVREYDQATGGNVVAEEHVVVTFVVTAGTFDGTVDTKHFSTANPGTGVSQALTSGSVVLTNTATGVAIPAANVSYDTANKCYKITGLTVGQTYSVSVKGVQVPGVFIDNDHKAATVKLYQVSFAVDPTSGSTAGMTGAGYYLENESMGISAPDTQDIGGKTYTFAKWTTDDLGDTPTELFGATTAFRMPANAVTMTANYSEPAADTYTVTYDPGVATGVAVPVDTRQYKTNDTVMVSSMTPVWPGYTFDGWERSDDRTTVNVNATFKMPDTNVTLTAQWTKVSGLTWTESLPTGTYGSDYHGSVALKDTSLTGPVTYSSADLPGGLTMATDGTITGKPYIVGDNMAITVTATSTTDTNLTWTYTLGKITVKKAVPTLVVNDATGAVVGQSYKMATYVVGVTVPKWDGGTNWSNATYSYTTVPGTATKTETSGTLTIPDTTADKFNAGTNPVPLSWTPSDDTSADSNGNKYSAIYESGTVNAILGADGTYGITADPIANTWTVKEGYTVSAAGTDGTVDTTTNTANALRVTIQNIGSQATGDLTLKLGPDSKFELGTGITSPVSSIDKDGSATITVQPKADVTEGVYTDTLTIENTTTKVKATVALTLVVNRADTFTFEVDTKLHPMTGDAYLGDVVKIQLKAAGETGKDPTGHVNSSGVYTWNDLESSKSYIVVVNGCETTNVVSFSTTSPMTIDLYQVVVTAGTNGTATLVNENNNGYYVKGQSYAANATPDPGYAFDKWAKEERGVAEISDYSTSPNIKDVMGDKAVTLTASFREIVEYTVVIATPAPSTWSIGYNGGENHTNILTGGVSDGGHTTYKVLDNAAFGLPTAVTTVAPGQYTMTWAGHTFRGWATTPSATVGAYAFTANTAADNGDNNEDRIITLYPVWTKDSDLALAPGVIKGVYKHELVGQQVGPATGGTAPYGFAPMTGLPFGLALGSQTAGTVQVNGKPNDVGTATATITVTDKAGATATADYAFVIEKADMKLKDADKPTLTTGVSVTVGDDISTAINGVLAGIKPDGDGTGETDINGAWTIGDVTGLTSPGAYYVPVTYTPANGSSDHAKDGDHYNVYTDTIKVTVEAKLITAADIKVTAPSAGFVPQDKNAVFANGGHTLTPSDAAYATDVEIADVFWSPAAANFAANTAYTVTVVLKIKDGSDYRFDTGSFTGTVNGKTSVQNTRTAETVSFSYTFPKENTVVDSINVNTTNPAVDTSSTTWSVNVQDAAKYYVDSAATKWVTTSGSTDVTGANPFKDGTQYDAVVVVKAQDGYEFSTANFGGAVNADITAHAKINDANAPEGSHTAVIAVALSSDHKTLTIRYSAFVPVAKQVVDVYVTGTPGEYYAQTEDSAKHHDGNATGNKNGIDFSFDSSRIQVYPIYEDGERGKTAITSGYTIGKVIGGTFTPVPATFKDYGGNSDVATWDGSTLVVRYGTDKDTPISGTLTVKQLKADSIALNGSVTTDYTSSKTFAASATATVRFNAGTVLENDVPGLTVGTKPATVRTAAAAGDNRENFYYMLDSDSNGVITDADTPLAIGTSITADMHNKDIYACYTDVNGYLVYTKVGTVKTSVEFTVSVSDENGHDPEYGDKLTADPDGDDDSYTYQWQVQDGGNWVNIPGATGKDHTPGKDEVGKTIHVVVTDKATGTPVNSPDIEVKARSLNFEVSVQNKVKDGNANNRHTYDETDFTLKMVNNSYGGVILGDVVTLTPAGTWNNADTTRPPYANAEVDSQITWPAVTADGAGNTHTAADYAIGGAGARNTAGDLVYRLALQGQQINKGVIIAQNVTTVSHVDVHFEEIPVFSHSIPGEPSDVTLKTETKPGENTSMGTDVTAFTATWYKGAFNVTTPGTATGDSEFGAGTYTVVVKVKPRTESNYRYGDTTHFFFHFGSLGSEEVTVKDSTAAAAAANGVFVDGDGAYVMWYTFPDVERVKIQNVNVSVPQPVVETAHQDTGSRIQVLGTDSSDQMANLTMSGIKWYEDDSTTEMVAGAQFQGDHAYRAEFDLTATGGFEFAGNVNFIVNGVGPVVGADTNNNTGNPAIDSVKTEKTSDTEYHVVVTFAQLKGGKVNLTDVYVNAVVPAEDKAPDAGYKPSVDAVKPYALTGTNDVWQYWSGSNWITITDANKGTALGTDGHFLAGMPYRVTGTVKLTDITHYQITDDTKFYLAGIECTTDMVDSVVNGQAQYAPLEKNGDGTYTLTRQFYIPVDRVIIEVTTNATAPAVGGNATSDTYKKSGKVTLAVNANGNVLTNRVTAGDVTWTEATGASVTTFDKGKSYKATYTLTINETGYTFATSVKFTIHGIDVNTGDPEKLDTASGITVRAVRDSDTQCTVTVTYPETQSDAAIVDVTVNYTAPRDGATPAVSLNYASTEQVTLDRTGLKDNDNSNGSTWHTGTKAGTVVKEDGTFNTGDYVVASTFTAKDGFVFNNATKFIVNGTEYTKAANGADVVISSDGKTATVYHLFHGQDKTIVRVAANVQQPVAGETRSTDVSKILAQNKDNDDMLSHITVGAVTWTVSNTSGGTYGAATGTTFEANRYYRATFTVEANSGYSFLSGDATDGDVDFLVNGIFKTGTTWIDGADTATASGIKVTTTGSGNSYTVTVDFPVTGSVANVLTVWGNGNAVAGELITKPTVPGSEPYEAISAQTKWQHKETDGSWTDVNSGDFKPGHTYKAVIRTQIKAVNAGQYQFTTSTAGYINDTEPGKTKVTYLDAAGNITTGTPVYVQLEREFELDKEIVDVHVSSLKPTKDATDLPTAISVPSAYQKFYQFENVGTDTKWDGITPVAEGETYTMTVKVTPKDGYALPTGADAKSHFFWDENSATAATWTGTADQATVTFTFSLGGSAPQPKDPVVWIDPPVKGQALDHTPTSPNTSVTPINGKTTWTSGGAPVTTAEAGKSYTAKIYIEANSPDGDRTYAAGDQIDLDGQKVNVQQDDGGLYITRTWSLPADPPPEIIPGPGGTTTVTEELPVVTYWISDHGFTNDLTAEKMARKGAKPTFTPKVSGKEGYTFKGWSEVDPATLKQGEELKLVDPLTFSISEDKTFYAVYDEPRFEHDHYVSGYPDGTFKPEQYITRAEVAAIVANACLDGFDNNENYGNPGNYSDVNPKKWYGNDIAYCTMYGVFSGYKDGTFKPDQYITRQELAVVVANMAGMQTNIGMPFTDASSINKWARDGVYTVYKNNWVSGYPDGTFRPQNNITRAETVAIFNGYLHRGVDADGLAELTPYVLNAAAGGYQGDGSSLYMTWTDVPEKYWAYYHIIEAANDHDYHWADEETKLPPEHWDAAYIDQEWRYREEFPVTYVVGDHGTAPASAVLNLSVKSGGRPRTQPHIDPNTDWLFLGWSLTPAGDIVEPLTVTITGATTFYAVYAPQATTYTVRYDAGANGAVSGASSESVIEGQRPAHVPAVNAHEGYTFLGWAETPNGTVVSPADVTIAANKTFYAVYRADQPQAQLQSHTAYMSGYDDGTFRPSQAITRAEVVAMVVRALGTDYDPNHVYDTSSVTDVAGHSAENMIGYCIEKGIFSGYKDGTFLPEGTMTRQEFAVVIANLAGGAQENQGLPFTDANSVNKWARNAVYTVYVNGWIGGYKDGTFQPKNNITRAEAAVIFNGFLGRTVDKTSLVDVPQGATSPWSDVKATNWAYQNIMEATADHSFYLDDGVEHWAEP